MSTLNKTALALALGLVFNGAQSADEMTGKRVDNARVDLHALPSPGEVEPSLGYPLPSGVTVAQAQAMKAANATLPQTPATERKAYGDALTGALFVSGRAFLTEPSKAALDALIGELEAWKKQVRSLLTLIGAVDLDALRESDLLITGATADFANLRGIDLRSLAQRSETTA